MIKKAQADLRRRYHSFQSGKNLPDFVLPFAHDRDEREEVERLWIEVFGNLKDFYCDEEEEARKLRDIQDSVVIPNEQRV